MYKEEKIINGILHYRTSPNAEFKPYTLENLTGIVGMLKEEMQKQEQVNIEGKDPITIDCTSMIYNLKGGAIPKLGTKEFNNLAMEMFGGKPKQQTAVEWLCEQYYLKQDIEIVKQAKEMEKQQQDDFAIGFAEWCIKKRIDFFDSTEIGETYTINGFVSKYKMNELLKIYKKEKGL
jgi:hypothetical protein